MCCTVAACWIFFLWFFKLQCMLLGKKSYPLDFSFKFNAIKFGNLLMNCFIREKMFTYCYNKFRLLNCMHYVKCSVNDLLHIIVVMQKVCGSLDHYFTAAHTIINSTWSTDSLLCDDPRNKAPRMAYFRLCPLVGRGLSLAGRWTNMTAELRWFRWPVLVMTALEPHNICCLTWSYELGVGATLAFSCFYNQIPHQ